MVAHTVRFFLAVVSISSRRSVADTSSFFSLSLTGRTFTPSFPLQAHQGPDCFLSLSACWYYS